MVDYFAILGLKPSASETEIKEAYRRLAKKYHPDSRRKDDPTITDAAKKMQLINQAKAVLFDPVKREEHRVVLGMIDSVSRERLIAENLRAFRNRPFDPPYHPPQETRSWLGKYAKRLYVTLGFVVLFVIGIVVFEQFRPAQASLPPIQEIIERHNLYHDPQPFGAKVELDTLSVPDDSLPKLLRMADIFYGLGEYKAASKYWEKCLEQDSSNEELIRNLSMAYFKRGKYAKSLEILSKQMHGDSNLVVAYYNIGNLFMQEEKPIDARNAYEEVVRIGDKMQQEGHTKPDYEVLAQHQLAKLN